MSELFKFTACMTVGFVVFGLLCIFEKDTLWKIDLASRKAAGWPEERLKRTPQWDAMYDLIGAVAIGWAAVWVFLYIFIY